MRSKKSSTPCRARVRRRAGPRSSAALPVATSGRDASRIAPRPSASSATRILPIPTGLAAETSPQPKLSQQQSSGSGRQIGEPGNRFVVCTGGEPLLQIDTELIDALHACSFEIAVETNGTIAAPAGLDWICVSPKAGAGFQQRSGDELKLVYPQPGAEPNQFEDLPFRHFFLQPMDGPARELNTTLALKYCLEHPRWQLSLQTHKLLGIP